LTWDGFVGERVGTGWLVVERKLSDAKDSGSNFSVGFFVDKVGQRAFMKVFELDRLMKRSRGDIKVMNTWLDLFEHECALLAKCQKANTKHVISVLERGAFHFPTINPNIDFQFLILEMAHVDLRRHYNYSAAVDLAFALTVAKHVAEGLRELHDIDIAHQDLKPSNILLLGPNTSPFANTKIADLGSASCPAIPIWHDAHIFWGDPAYAPPEALYNEEYSDWHDRRTAKDLWLLGSLLIFLITKVNLTAQLRLAVPAAYQAGTWGDPYQYVVPVLRNALNSVLSSQAALNTPVGKQIRSLVQELCNPDPIKRGSPRIVSRPAKYSMQRYISSLDRLLRHVLIFGDR
jgi:serine/threonine protein kinase